MKNCADAKSNRPLRFGLVGCGTIAQKKHLPALAKREDVIVAAFTDIDEASAYAMCHQYGGEGALVYPTPSALFRQKDIDAVCICTPSGQHAEHSLAALAEGKHVLCEKPMATHYADALAMAQAAKAQGLVMYIAYQNRFTPKAQYAHRLAQAGALGEVYHIEAVAQRTRAVPTWGQFLSKEGQGGGAMADIGCHVLDLAFWATGNFRPRYAACRSYNHIAQRGSHANRFGPWNPEAFSAEDSAFGFVVMEDGMSIALRAAWAMNTTDEREGVICLYGSKAGLEMLPEPVLTTEIEGKICTIHPRMQPEARLLSAVPEEKTPGDLELGTFIDALLGKSNTDFAGQALASALALEALYLSARDNRPVMMAEIGEAIL